MTAVLDRPGTRARRRWPVPAALIALSLVPVVAGAARLVELAGGPAALPEPPHSAGAPFPLVLHIVSALVFTVLGAFQFVPGTRRARPRWHRTSGRLVAAAGLLAAGSGLWLTVVITDADSGLLTALRTAAGTAWAVSIALGVAAVLRRDLARHRAWMLRGYALGAGAGTTVLTTLAWLLVVGQPGETAGALLMGAAWAINLVVAEWVVRRPGGRRLAVRA